MSEPPPLRGTSFQRKEGDTRIPHPRIVISSENETSFSFAIGEEMGGQRITGDTALSATWEHGASCRQLYEGKRKGETKRGNEKDPSAALGMMKRGKATSHFFSFRYGSQPPPLRGTSFQRKEGDTRMPFSPYRHFERKREIFFVRDRSGKVRTADNGKHRIPRDFILGAVFPQKVSRRFAFFAAF